MSVIVDVVAIVEDDERPHLVLEPLRGNEIAGHRHGVVGDAQWVDRMGAERQALVQSVDLLAERGEEAGIEGSAEERMEGGGVEGARPQTETPARADAVALPRAVSPSAFNRSAAATQAP